MSNPEYKPRRLRFSLSFMFLLLAGVGCCIFVGLNSDWLAGAILLVAMLLFAAAYYLPVGHYRFLFRSALVSLAAFLAWFALVDGYATFMGCEYCVIHHYTAEYRLAGIPVQSTKVFEHNDFLDRIARDLGSPCKHRYKRMPLERWWGLLVCMRPCISIHCCLAGDDNYEEKYHRKVVQFGKRHPDLAAEYHRWLEAKGWESNPEYLRWFLQRIENEELRTDP